MLVFTGIHRRTARCYSSGPLSHQTPTNPPSRTQEGSQGSPTDAQFEVQGFSGARATGPGNSSWPFFIPLKT